MTKILIIGKDSYIGKNLKKHFLNRSKGFIVNSISVRNNDWKNINLGIYDCIIYLAAAKPEHEEGNSEILNYHLNTDMPYEIAQTAKACGVSRFVFPSTIDVYGRSSAIGCSNVIGKDTEPAPESVYAKSKLDGENKLRTLEDDSFKVTVLRLPLVYGSGCPGNYNKIKEIVLSQMKLPAFSNELSAINIGTLCAFIQYIIENDFTGTFHPQNKSYISTLELMDMISKELLVPMSTSKWLNFKYSLFKNSCPKDIKEFMGTLVYSREIDL